MSPLYIVSCMQNILKLLMSMIFKHVVVATSIAFKSFVKEHDANCPHYTDIIELSTFRN